jgi:Ras-related protein Rab-1A
VSIEGSIVKERIEKDVLSGNWDVQYLMEEGKWNHEARNYFPNLFNLLSQLPIAENGFGYVYFSTLTPNTRLRPHCGPTNTKLRILFPLNITELPREEDDSLENRKNLLVVDGKSIEFETNKPIIFDDSFLHEVIMSSHSTRLALLIDIWHPDLQEDKESKLLITNQFSVKEGTMESTVSPPSDIEANTIKEKEELIYTDKITPYHGKATFTSLADIRDASYDYLFKLLMIGDSFVGKSSYVVRLADNVYSDNYMSTIGVDFRIILVDYEFAEDDANDLHKRIKVQLWDIAGPERFRTITKSYYRGTHGVLVSFDVTNRESFLNVENLIHQVIENNVESFILVGMKADQVDSKSRHPRVVAFNEGDTLARKYHTSYVECSSKDYYHILQVLEAIIYRVLNSTRFSEQQLQPRPPPRQVPSPRTGNSCVIS